MQKPMPNKKKSQGPKPTLGESAGTKYTFKPVFY